ncbi:MAG: hypothetical protein AAFN27_00535 [Pseudomonadota bacterium]
MKAHSLFPVLAGVVTTTAVVAGLITVGGGEDARHKRFDVKRIKELREIASSLMCVRSKAPAQVLPETLNVESIGAYCHRPKYLVETDLTDDETGEHYRYLRRSDWDFSICAEFHDPHDVELRRWNVRLNPRTGCIDDRVIGAPATASDNS